MISPQTRAPNAMSFDATSMDLPTDLMPIKAQRGVRVRFTYMRVPITAIDGQTITRYDTRLAVVKRPLGDISTVSATFISEEQAMRHYPVEFAAFKQNEDVPTDGTPLHELPGISQSQVSLFNSYGLSSIEDVAGLESSQASRMGPEAGAAQRLAKKWLDRKTEQAPMIDTAALEAQYSAQAAADKEAMAAMRAELDAMRTAMAMIQGQGAAPQQGAAMVPQPAADNTYVIPEDVVYGSAVADAPISGGDPWDK